MAPRPLDEINTEGNFIRSGPTNVWWVETNQERLKLDEDRGTHDGPKNPDSISPVDLGHPPQVDP